LFIDQARIYFGPGKYPYKICNFIEDILKREARINFSCNFRKDYVKIINSWCPNRRYVLKEDMFLNSNHIGLYLYYSILKEWRSKIVDFRDHIKEEKESRVYSHTGKEIIENLYRHSIGNIEIKLNLYLNKIECNNLPYKEIKYELIIELINIIENNHGKISKYFEELTKARKVILSNFDFLRDKLENSRLFELLEILNINYKTSSTIIY